MAIAPITWHLEMKGGDAARAELDRLSEAFNRAKASGAGYGKEQRALSTAVSRRLNEDRMQGRLLLAQHTSLLKVSRAISTITSISRSLLTISNALNISKISGNLQDIETMTINKELNELKRKRGELEDAGLKYGKEWITVVEEINIKEAQLKQNNQDLIDQKWDNMITSILATFSTIGIIFSNLINNKTILAALIKAGTFFGALFGGLFTFVSSTIIAAGTWLKTSLFGAGISKAAIQSGARAGGLFGTAFIINAAKPLSIITAILGGQAIVEYLKDNVEWYKKANEENSKYWDSLLNLPSGTSQKGMFEGIGDMMSPTTMNDEPKSKKSPTSSINEKDIKKQVNFFQPLLDLFTKGLPQAFGETETKLEDTMSNVIPTTIATNAPIIVEGFKSMWNAVVAITNAAGTGLIAGVNSIFYSLISSMNRAISAYNSAASRMRQSTIPMLSFSPAMFTPIPNIKAATGFDGMVNRPTMFLAGEAGPEQVSITPNGGGRSGGGNTLIINVGGSVVTERKLAQIVDQYQKQNLKSRGFTGFG